jgi:hypothetical protein
MICIIAAIIILLILLLYITNNEHFTIVANKDLEPDNRCGDIKSVDDLKQKINYIIPPNVILSNNVNVTMKPIQKCGICADSDTGTALITTPYSRYLSVAAKLYRPSLMLNTADTEWNTLVSKNDDIYTYYQSLIIVYQNILYTFITIKLF